MIQSLQDNTRLNIAVVGCGVSGLTAAHLLRKKHDVVLYEKNSYVGGHTNTITIEDGPDVGTAVDTGFVVMNTQNYPLFTRLLNDLDVSRQDSDMSFSYHCLLTGYQYAGTNWKGLFGRRRNLVNRAHWSMLNGIVGFNKMAKADLNEGTTAGVSLGEYLDQRGVNTHVRSKYVVPMGSAIWSTAPAQLMDFPAESFLRFFDNHGLLSVNDHPQWQTVMGGSQSYVRKILAEFEGRVRINASIDHIRRSGEQVVIRLADGQENVYDRVIIGTHADEALNLLGDASALEKDLLGAWEYAANDTVLHTDPSHMPTKNAVWASWNFTRESEDGDQRPASITYHMNRLQNLETQKQYFVSLNRQKPIPDEAVVRRMNYMHPMFTFSSMATQHRLPQLNENGLTYFCGSYFGYGFHEDAVRAGVQVAEAFGVSL